MMMPWFKMYPEARNDPKLRALTRDQHYVWFNLLCYAAEQPDRGLIADGDETVLACAVADGDVELLRSALERLVALQLIDKTEEGITPHGWVKRQAKSDTTAADRSRRYRERLKTTTGKRKNASRVTERDATRDVTRDERVTSRPVTVPSRETSRPEIKDREEDKDNTAGESVDVLKFDAQAAKGACPSYPEGDGGMHDIFPGSYSMPEEQARQLFKAVWDCWKNDKLCFEFYSRQEWHTYDVWRAAFRKAKEQGKAINSIGYVERIAADYQANGIPTPKPSQASPHAPARKEAPDPAWSKQLHPPGWICPDKYRNPNTTQRLVAEGA